MNREIIADYIKSPKEKESFLNGIKGTYTISYLNFLKLKDSYDFCDGNSYVFSNCLVNTNLKFSGRRILFDECIFNGDIDISNIGTSREPNDFKIKIDRCKSDENLRNLRFNSPSLCVRGNKIRATESITFSGTNGNFEMWFDDMDAYRNDIRCENGEINIDFITSSFEATTLFAKTINVTEYNNLIISYCSLSGILKNINRGRIMENETLIIETTINNKRLTEFVSNGNAIKDESIKER